MAKGKKQPWDAVFDQINFHRAPDWVPVPPATDSELDQFEANLGSSLPLSYREFLKRFGAGELEGTLRLTPLVPGTLVNRTVLEDTHDQREEFSARYTHNAEWLGRVVYFGCNAGGELYVWDPIELAESDNQECPVYWLPRHEEDQPELVANSFFEYVHVVLERVREWRADEEPEEGELGDAFEPYYLRMKTAPEESDVKLWLAFNNNTVCDLALSIRDRGQTD